MGLGKEPLRKFHRAHVVIALGDGDPGEHRGLRHGDLPAGATEAFDEHVAAPAIEVAIELDDVLRAVERGNRGGLDGRERAIVQVRLHAGESRDQARVADREADPPAGHAVGLRHGGELDRDLSRALDLQD